jgi:hypothetical protein
MAFEFAWWEYFLIPWIAGLVGYVTNVVALQLTFYPLEFFGIEFFRLKDEPWGIIGWQVCTNKSRTTSPSCIVYLYLYLYQLSEAYFSEMFSRLNIHYSRHINIKRLFDSFLAPSP